MAGVRTPKRRDHDASHKRPDLWSCRVVLGQQFVVFAVRAGIVLNDEHDRIESGLIGRVLLDDLVGLLKIGLGIGTILDQFLAFLGSSRRELLLKLLHLLRVFAQRLNLIGPAAGNLAGSGRFVVGPYRGG